LGLTDHKTENNFIKAAPFLSGVNQSQNNQSSSPRGLLKSWNWPMVDKSTLLGCGKLGQTGKQPQKACCCNKYSVLPLLFRSVCLHANGLLGALGSCQCQLQPLWGK